MKNITFLSFFVILQGYSTWLLAQNHLDIDGGVKIHRMDTVESNGYLVARQSDGTLALVPSSAAEEVESPKFLNLAPGFEYSGQGYQIGMFYKHKNRVYLDGLIKKSQGTIVLGDTLFQLPLPYRPAVDTDIYGKQRDEIIHLRLQKNGVVFVKSSPVAIINWVAIDGLNFFIP